jgi:tetratricopeptide (TPR) repeat protein
MAAGKQKKRQKKAAPQDRGSGPPVQRADPAARLESRLTPRVRLLLVAGLLSAIALVRILYLAEFGQFVFQSGDTKFFINYAKAITAGDLFLRGQSLLFSPLYAYFLAAVFTVAGENYLWVLVVQYGLSILSAYLLYRLSRDLFGTLAGLCTLALYLFYSLILVFDSQLLDTVFSVLLPSAALLLLHRAPITGRLRQWFGAGIVLGLFALTRPNVMLFFPLAAAWAFWAGGAGKALARRLVPAAMVTVGAALCILPFTVRNWVVTGEPVLITAHGGINFYVGNNENATGFFTPPHGMPPLPGIFNLAVPRRVAEMQSGRTGLSDSEVSDYWFKRGTAWIRENPGDFLALTWKKTRAYFNGYEVSLNFDFNYLRQISWSLKIAFLPLAVLLPLGLAGMALSLRWWRTHLLFTMFFFSYSASVILFFITARYRLPVVPLLLVYGGFTLRTLVAWLGRPARLAILIVALVLSGVLLNTDLGIYFQPSLVTHSQAYMLECMGRIDEAVAKYELSLRQDRTLGLSHLHLARIHARQGDNERAMNHYRAALQLAPGDQTLQRELNLFEAHLRSQAGQGPLAPAGAPGGAAR